MRTASHLFRSQAFRQKKTVIAVSAALCASIAGMPTNAKDDTATKTSGEGGDYRLEEILVTGSHIRGIDPTGTLTIGINTEDIEISGAKTANEVLGTLPQVDNLFNSRASLDPRAISQVTINRPNLRGLPGFNQASGAATLVLFNSQRIVGMGTVQSSPDPDIIPPALIERVEVITDGGSALYGADAVGGVVNILTKSKFDGVQIEAGYNAGDDYDGFDTTFTAGTSWGDGDVFVSLSYADRDSILVEDRDWAAEGVWTDNGLVPNGIECPSPVGTTQTFIASDFGGVIAPATVWDGRDYPEQSLGERCDTTGLRSLQPEEDRGSIFLGATQSLSDTLTFEVTGYYSERNTTFEGFPVGDTVSYGPSQFQPTSGPDGDFLPVGTETEGGALGFSYAAHPAYRHRDAESNLETWGITPELIVELKNDWQLRNTLHYSFSDSKNAEYGSDSEVLNEAIAAGLVDPANIATTDPAVLNQILDSEFVAQQEQEMLQVRVLGDGPLIELPAGELRLATGVEYTEQENKFRRVAGPQGGYRDTPFDRADRDITSVFAEFNIPLLTNMTGVDSLILSAAVRYDDYSDFGDTTNPQLGLTWRPVDWMSVHAKWGESFVAPTLTDQLNASGSIAYNPGVVPSFVQAGADVAGVVIEEGREGVYFLNGAQGQLDPQTSETWAIAVELLPPAIEGMYFSVNYYEIEFFDLLGTINPQQTSAPTIYPERYLWNPSAEELQAFSELATNGDEAFASIPDPDNVALALDLRVGNTDEAYLKGFDVAVGYQHDTNIGTMMYSLSGTHKTEFELVSGTTSIDNLDYDTPDTLATASIGLQRDAVRAELTWRYTGGFDTQQGERGQRSVDDFQTWDFFLGYDFDSSNWTDGLSLRFTVSNLLDEDPPLWRRNDQPSYSGFTLGRVFGFGFTKRFD